MSMPCNKGGTFSQNMKRKKKPRKKKANGSVKAL